MTCVQCNWEIEFVFSPEIIPSGWLGSKHQLTLKKIHLLFTAWHDNVTKPRLSQQRRERLEEDLCWTITHVSPDDPVAGQGTELNCARRCASRLLHAEPLQNPPTRPQHSCLLRSPMYYCRHDVFVVLITERRLWVLSVFFFHSPSPSPWGTTDDFTTSFLHFSVFHCPLGLGEPQACLFPDVVFPLLFLSVSSSFPFNCALRDGFGQTWWTGDMSIPNQFASLYDGQEVFVWSDCLPDLGIDFFVCNTVVVWDA